MQLFAATVRTRAALRPRGVAARVLAVAVLLAQFLLAQFVLLSQVVVAQPVAHAAPAVTASAAPSPQRQQLQLQTRADLPAALFWLLSGLAGDPYIDGPGYKKWWQQAGLTKPSDDALVARFAQLRQTYRGRFLDAKVRDNPWVPLPPPAAYRLDVRWAALFLGARDEADLLRRAEVLLTEPDQLALRAVVADFAPRLRVVLDRSPWLGQFRAAFDTYAANAKMPDFLMQVGQLLGVPADAWGASVLRVHFVPAPGGEVLHGRRLGNDLVVEVRPDDPPKRRADVVVHEATHWLQERAGNDDDPQLIQAVFGTKLPAAAPTWELLSEAVATAIGQGEWLRRTDPQQYQDSLAKANSWYVDARIDGLAKAIAPLLQDALQGSQSLAEIAPAFVHAAATLPPAQRVADLLGRYVLLCDQRDAPWMQSAWWQLVPPRAVWRADLREAGDWARRHQAVTLVVAATWDQWAQLPKRDVAALGVQLPKSALRKGKWLVSVPRIGGAQVLAVAATDEAALAAALTTLARSPWPLTQTGTGPRGMAH